MANHLYFYKCVEDLHYKTTDNKYKYNIQKMFLTGFKLKI